jgi:hypothetical protein
MFDSIPDLLHVIAWYAAWLVYIRCYCCGNSNCSECQGGTTSESYQIDIAGIVTGGVACAGADCENLNTTYIATQFAPASCLFDDLSASACSGSYDRVRLGFGLNDTSVSSGDLQVEIHKTTGHPSQSILFQSTYSAPRDCQMTGENVPLAQDGDSTRCNAASATCFITSL